MLVLFAIFVVVAIAALIWAVVFLNRAVAPVRLAVNAAQASSEFRNAVGQPVKTGVFVRGRMDLFSSAGNAHLTIPVSGERGRGVLREWAQQDAGKWRLCGLVYRPEGGESQVTIVSDKGSPCRPD